MILIFVLSILLVTTWTAAAAPEEEATPAAAPAAAPAQAVPPSPQELTGKTVAFVDIAGAVNIRPDTILAVSRLKPGDIWTPDKVRQDLRLIYEMGTFADVTADFTVIPEGVKVVYSVKENPILKGISLQGNKKVGKDKILPLMTVKTGQVLNSKTVAANIRAVEDYYKAQGYILIKIKDVNLGPDGMLSIGINEGIIEDIVVKGNTRTKTKVITREMLIQKGDPFNSKDARRSMQKLYNLGFFEDVNIKLIPGKLPGGTVIEMTVVEQKTGTFSIGGGYSDSDGLVGIITVGDKNFRGTGDDVNVRWEFGGNSYSSGNYSLGFKRPWIDRKRTSFGFNLYNMTNQYTDYDTNGNDISSYDRQYRGFDFTFGRPVNEFVTHLITFKNRTDEYKQWVDGANYETDPVYADFIPDNFGLTRSILLSRIYDTRDNVSNPSTGTRYMMGLEVAGFGGDFTFNKLNYELRRYWAVGKHQNLAFRFNAGYGTGHIAYAQLYSAGGIDSLRGYRDDQFKGNRMATSSLEYRFPIAKKVSAVLFTDVGNAWDSDPDSYPPDLVSEFAFKVGYGFGIRLVTPFGPIRLDYGLGSQGGRLHFGFGGQY